MKDSCVGAVFGLIFGVILDHRVLFPHLENGAGWGITFVWLTAQPWPQDGMSSVFSEMRKTKYSPCSNSIAPTSSCDQTGGGSTEHSRASCLHTRLPAAYMLGTKEGHSGQWLAL